MDTDSYSSSLRKKNKIFFEIQSMNMKLVTKEKKNENKNREMFDLRKYRNKKQKSINTNTKKKYSVTKHVTNDFACLVTSPYIYIIEIQTKS